MSLIAAACTSPQLDFSAGPFFVLCRSKTKKHFRLSLSFRRMTKKPSEEIGHKETGSRAEPIFSGYAAILLGWALGARCKAALVR